MQSPYDAFAWFYDRYWAAPFQEWQLPALDKLLFPNLGAGARVLDLCCGTGQLCKKLAARGYNVTGLDGSAEMLHAARRTAPQCSFIHADAADFALPEEVDAAVCLFDSLNHLLEPDKLAATFSNVYAALRPGGRFVFDVNTEAAYGHRWNESACEVAPDHAFFLRGGFDQLDLRGVTRITMFRLLEGWQRSDVEMIQRPWEVSEIEPLLAAAGFQFVASSRAVEDLCMNTNYGEGRVYFVACRDSRAKVG